MRNLSIAVSRMVTIGIVFDDFPALFELHAEKNKSDRIVIVLLDCIGTSLHPSLLMLSTSFI